MASKQIKRTLLKCVCVCVYLLHQNSGYAGSSDVVMLEVNSFGGLFKLNNYKEFEFKMVSLCFFLKKRLNKKDQKTVLSLERILK